MARARTNSDVFNAIAEPQRRQILLFLLERERPVTEVVDELEMEQPAVSKHLRVLRDVGLVQVRRDGRHKFYRTRAEGLRPIHEWSAMFERYWSHQLLRVKQRAEKLAQSEKPQARK